MFSEKKFHLWKILYHVKRKVSQNILLVGLDWSRAIYSTYKWSKISARVINWKSLILTLTKDQFFKKFYWLLVWFCHFHQILLSFNLNEIFSKNSDSKSIVNFCHFFAQNVKNLENSIEFSKYIVFVKSLDPNGQLIMNNEVQTCSILTLKMLEKRCMRSQFKVILPQLLKKSWEK